jgi:hypothetical protein
MTMRVRHVVVAMLGSVLLVAARPVAAQQAAAGAPRAVAERIFAALSGKNADAFARDMHPAELAAFKGAVMASLADLKTDQERQGAVDFFAGVSKFDQIGALPPDRFFAAYMGGVFRRMRASGDVQMQYQVLGQVPEGKDLMHVVYRARVSQGERSASDVSVLTLRQSPGGWKATLTGDLRAIAGPAAAPE